MSPRALQSETAVTHDTSPLLIAMLTGKTTARSVPANDVATRGRSNILVQRRRRQHRISTR